MLSRIHLVIVACLALTVIFPAAAHATFSDLPSDHWAYDAVVYLEEEGLVTGFPDGTFRGPDTLTRYEFAMVIVRLYDQFLDMVDEDPGIDIEVILEALMEEFQPEIDELRELIMGNTERIEALEGTVDGLGGSVDEIMLHLDEMDRRFHPYGDLQLKFYGQYPETGLQSQRAQFQAHWGFVSQVTDELTFGLRMRTGQEGSRQSGFDTMDDAFGFDSVTFDRAYMTWMPEAYPGFTMWAGKFAPPWRTTPMVMDSDVQVEGLAQRFDWNNFRFYLGELVPAREGFYIVAQVGVDDLLLDDTHLALTYHYINNEAWTHLSADMMSGALTNRWDFSRLETPDDYRAIEVYWDWTYQLADVPFKLRLNYLHNLEDTAPGLEDEAGWQRAAWASLTFNDLVLRERGDWLGWVEFGRRQPNSVLPWLADSTRGYSDGEFWLVGYKYRLMANTDFLIYYLSMESLSLPLDEQQRVVAQISTYFM